MALAILPLASQLPSLQCHATPKSTTSVIAPKLSVIQVSKPYQEAVWQI